jgi:hypothetical protein
VQAFSYNRREILTLCRLNDSNNGVACDFSAIKAFINRRKSNNGARIEIPVNFVEAPGLSLDPLLDSISRADFLRDRDEEDQDREHEHTEGAQLLK